MNTMKKRITLSIVAIILILSAVSCVPKTVCVCTETHEDPNIPTETYEKDLASAGLKKCSELNATFEDASGRTTIECEKKPF